MAALSGVKGNISLPAGTGTPLLVIRWQGSFEREIFDVSGFDNALNERDKVGGMAHMVGTCDAVVDSSAVPLLTSQQTEDLVAPGNLRLISKRGAVLDAHYIFAGMISVTSVDVPKFGLQTWSLQFESTGQITIQQQSDI